MRHPIRVQDTRHGNSIKWEKFTKSTTRTIFTHKNPTVEWKPPRTYDIHAMNIQTYVHQWKTTEQLKYTSPFFPQFDLILNI